MKNTLKSCMNLWKVTAVCMAVVLFASTSMQYVAAKSSGYQFTYNKVTISMHGKAAKFIKKAGKPKKIKVKKSCAYKGKDRTRWYDGFILYTYSKSDKGAEYVSGVTFRDDSVKTPEGIKIGSSLSDVQKAYGKTKDEFGIYTYKKGDSRLQIEIIDNKVTNLRYTIASNK